MKNYSGFPVNKTNLACEVSFTTLNKSRDCYEMFHRELRESLPADVKDLKTFFHYLRKTEKGRFSKMYRDDKKEGARHVGYIITRKNTDDDGESYTEAVWFELLEPVEVLEKVLKYKTFGERTENNEKRE